MIGFHLQRPVQNWPQAVALLPAGTWFKAVDNVQALSEARSVNPGIKTVLRHWYDPHQVFGGDLEANKVRARTFLNTFVDGTFRQHAPNVDAIEDWNEYLANSQNQQERQDRITWVRALSEVWTQEWRTQPDLAHIRLVVANAAVGNDIPQEIAHQVQVHDNILGYHAYLPIWQNVVTPVNEWAYYSGRWATMDATFRANNIYVDWLFTEMGSVRNVNGGGSLDPQGGWKHPDVHGGNVNNYTNALAYWLDKTALWNEQQGDRCYGGVLFTTSGNLPGWEWFEVQQPAMGQIAQFVHDYAPPPGGGGGAWDDEVWAESIIRQPISLNPGAALQAEIFSDGFTPVQSEFWYTPSDGVQRACQAAEQVSTGARRVYYAVVPNWNEVHWFTKDPDHPAWEKWPTQFKVITQAFGADPAYYGQFGLPGHEGLDIRATTGSVITSVWPGRVVDVHTNPNDHAYGIHVRVRLNKYVVVYAHLQTVAVTIGQPLLAGHVIGTADNTGNSRAPHLHLTMKHDDAYEGGPRYIGYPHNIIDPTPYSLPLIMV